MLTRRVRHLALAALLPSCLLASPAHAVWPVDPAVNLPLAAGTSVQYGPTVLPDGAGGMLIGFVDGYDIRMMRVNPDGSIRWNTTVCNATGVQQSVVMTSDGTGGAILAWSDSRSGNYDIYAQRVNTLGVVQWAANGVAVCIAAADQSVPVIAGNGSNGAIIVWQDLRNGAFFDLYAAGVSGAGAAGPAGGMAVSTAVGDQREVAITPVGPGGAALAWRDGRVDGGDIYAQLLVSSGAGVSNYWVAGGVAVAVQSGTQWGPAVAPDGQLGVLVFWADGRAGTSTDLYGQRFDVGSSARWGVSGGQPIANGAGNEISPAAISDGAGGAFVSFTDSRNAGLGTDIYAQHVSPAGGGMWGPTGTSVNTNAGYADYSSVMSDGAGGIVVSWLDLRFDPNAGDYFAQRLSAGGSRLWTSDGVAVTTAYSNGSIIEAPQMVPTPEGDALFAWSDSRDVFGNGDIYGQRVDHFGALGDPAPVMVSVRDVRNDQGGQVKVSWTASYLEYEPYLAVSEYRLYRSAPAAAALAAERAAGASAGDRIVRELHADGTLAYWELATIVAAQRSEDYGVVTATTSDSVGGSNPRTLFRVQARNSSGTQWWYSANDSGYSVDNLPPLAPAPLAGTYGSGTAHLTWNPNLEADLSGYRVYRGASASFTPAPGNLVGTPPDTGFVDAAGAPAFYKVTAVDVHGNESPASLVLPGGALAVDGSRPAVWSLARPEPNPARGGTTLRFALPREAHVTLAIYDAAGRRVRLLADGVAVAGGHEAAWDLRDDGGSAVGAGLYFARLEAGGLAFTRRVVALR